MNLDNERFLYWEKKKYLKQGFTFYHLQNDRASLMKSDHTKTHHWEMQNVWNKNTCSQITRFQRQKTQESGEKVINKSTGNHHGIQTEDGVEEYL